MTGQVTRGTIGGRCSFGGAARYAEQTYVFYLGMGQLNSFLSIRPYIKVSILLGQISGIQPDIRCQVKYLATYPVTGWILGWISNIYPDIKSSVCPQR